MVRMHLKCINWISVVRCQYTPVETKDYQQTTLVDKAKTKVYSIEVVM